MDSTLKINFSRISPRKFEALAYKVIKSFGFKNVTWRQGSDDDGRDIQAIKTIEKSLVEEYDEKWFFEMKHHTDGVNVEKLNSKIAWADADKPQHYVFILSTHLTNSANNWLEKIKSKKEYYIHVIQGNELKEILINMPALLVEFNLIENHLDTIELIKTDWVINSKIPSWELVLLTSKNSNLEVLSLNEKVLLASLNSIHFFSVTSWSAEEEEEFLEVHNSILDNLNFEFQKVSQGTLDFFEQSTNIEWIDDHNYGSLDIQAEEYYPTAYINCVKYQSTKGFVGVVKGYKNKNYILYPYFIAKNLKLSMILFKPVSTNIEEFIQKFKKLRPQEKELKGFNPIDIFIPEE